jgi:hypothetical protein
MIRGEGIAKVRHGFFHKKIALQKRNVFFKKKPCHVRQGFVRWILKSHEQFFGFRSKPVQAGAKKLNGGSIRERFRF